MKKILLYIIDVILEALGLQRKSEAEARQAEAEARAYVAGMEVRKKQEEERKKKDKEWQDAKDEGDTDKQFDIFRDDFNE